MERFLSRHNVARYHRLCDPSLSSVERLCILEQLAGELALLRQDMRLGRLPYEHGCADEGGRTSSAA